MRVEVEADHRAAVGHQRRHRLGEGLVGVGAGLEGELGALPRRLHELAADRVAGGEGDRVDRPVDPAPARLQLAPQRGDVLVGVDVEVEHLGRRVEPRRRALGHPFHPAEAGQQHLGPLRLRPLGDREGDAVAVDDPGDQDLLSLEDHVSPSYPGRTRCRNCSLRIIAADSRATVWWPRGRRVQAVGGERRRVAAAPGGRRPAGRARRSAPPPPG